MPFPRENLKQVARYAPDQQQCRIDLSDNTNLFGAPPSAQRALREAPVEALTRYPALYAGGLKEALARYAGVSPEWVVTGCGSDDVLDCSFRALVDPGQPLVHMHPSFSMVPVFARANGLEPVAVPLTRDFDADVDGLLAPKAPFIYLCSPNNPTGTVLSKPGVEQLLARQKGFVLMDEAYGEFGHESFLQEVEHHPRLIVTRTLSKAFGLAGLRIGYGVAHPEVIAEIEKARGPYKVNAFAERAALAVLTEDQDWMRTHAESARESRERMRLELVRLGLQPLPSEANFLLVPVKDSKGLGQALRDAGILVRVFTGLQGVGDALRITAGPWEQVSEALRVLGEALAS